MTLTTAQSTRAPQAAPARPLQVFPRWSLPRGLSRLLARRGAAAPVSTWIDLPGQHTLRLAEHAGYSVVCHRGRIWLTEPGGADIELRPGESCTLRAPGVAVAQAMESSSFQLRSPEITPRGRARATSARGMAPA